VPPSPKFQEDVDEEGVDVLVKLIVIGVVQGVGVLKVNPAVGFAPTVIKFGVAMLFVQEF